VTTNRRALVQKEVSVTNWSIRILQYWVKADSRKIGAMLLQAADRERVLKAREDMQRAMAENDQRIRSGLNIAPHSIMLFERIILIPWGAGPVLAEAQQHTNLTRETDTLLGPLMRFAITSTCRRHEAYYLKLPAQLIQSSNSSLQGEAPSTGSGGRGGPAAGGGVPGAVAEGGGSAGVRPGREIRPVRPARGAGRDRRPGGGQGAALVAMLSPAVNPRPQMS